MFLGECWGGACGAGGFLGQVLPAGEEADHRPALLGDRIPERTAQHRIVSLERVEDYDAQTMAADATTAEAPLL